MSKCEKRGYHNWIERPLSSIEEDCDEMTVVTTCDDCGAEFEARGEWTKMKETTLRERNKTA